MDVNHSTNLHEQRKAGLEALFQKKLKKEMERMRPWELRGGASSAGVRITLPANESPDFPGCSVHAQGLT
eukprot:2155300-Amphidinium_carterae.1